MHTEEGELARSRAICRLHHIENLIDTAVGHRPRRWITAAAIGLLGLSATAFTAKAACELYPIALSATTLAGKIPGDVLPDVFNGESPGHFGWLTWAGSPSVPTLVESLTPPGNRESYVNPYDPHDHEPSVGDWVRGKPGVSNSKQIRDALDTLKSMDITLPVWDLAHSSSKKTEYRISGFARVRLLSYRLPGQNRISALYLGTFQCGIVNQPPTVDAGPDQTVQLAEPVALHGLVTDDGLPDGGTPTLQWSQVSGPGNATFDDPSATNTSVSFDLPGTYELRLTASDSELSASDTCLVSVDQPNRPPVPSPSPVITAEDVSVDFELAAADPDDDPLTFRIVTPPAHGALSGDAPRLRYTPNADYFGSDQFTYEVSDGELSTGALTQLIEITEVNDAPTADTQTLSTSEDTPVSVQLSGADVEGAPLQFEVLAPPATGTLAGTPPHLIFTPAHNFFGSDSFRYRVNDGVLASAEATVVILVGEVNDPPVAFAQSLQLAEDSPLPVTLSGSDVEGSSLAFVVVTPPTRGTLSGTAPDLTYVPALNHHGADAFTFRVDDGALASEPVTVNFGIAPVNDPPTARASSVELVEDTTVTITLLGDDVDGDPMTYEIVAAPQHGTLAGIAPNFTYAPTSNFAGDDLIRFRVADAGSSSEPADVTITVRAVNDPPVALPLSLLTNEGSPVDFTLAGMDVEDDVLTFVVVTQPAHGTLTGSPPQLTYTPATDFHGTDQFTFRANDSALDSSEVTVTIEVQAVNEPPTVAIVAPIEGDAFAGGGAVFVRLQAADDAAVQRVSLFADAVLLAELTPPNLEFAWLNPPTGQHVLTAVATDAAGATGSAGPVTIQVFPQEFGDFAVHAGPDQIHVWPAAVQLNGAIQAAGGGEPGHQAIAWSSATGDPAVSFSNRHLLASEVSFSGPGEYELRLTVFDDAGFRTDTVRIVMLPPAPERPLAARTSQGREFWFTLLNNHGIIVEPNYLEALLIVQSEVDTELTLTVHSPYNEAPAVEQRHRITGGTATSIELPVDQTAPDLGLSDLVVRNAIHVRSADPVSAWLIQYQDDSSEGTLLLPTVLLGREYRVLTYENSPSVNQPGEIVEGSQFAVVATEPGTLVTIVPARTVGYRPAGEPFDLTLQPGETFRLIDQDQVDGDLTGTRILASKPVAVFGGHTCANVPAGVPACNQLVEQLPSIDTWGRRFLTVPLHGRSGGDTIRILASADNTVLRVQGESLRLDQGQFIERLIVEPAKILASRPVLVARFSNGGTFDSTAGDPAMTLVPPVEQFGGSSAFATPPPVWHNYVGEARDVFTHHAQVILPATGTTGLRLDGVALANDSLVPIGSSGYVAAQLQIAAGPHELTTTAPIGLWVYGWADFDAYGFLGGMFSDTVGPEIQLTLTQATSSALVGTKKTVTAQVTDELGRPVADHRVEFAVSGANSRAAQVTSNPLGLAVLEYTGSTAGEDVITARLAALERSVANNWITASPNQPPQVAAGDDRALFVTETLALAATVADDGLPAGGDLNLRWHTRNGPTAARFSDPHQASTAVTFDAPGRYELALAVHDAEFETVETLQVTVLDPVTLTLAGAQWNEAFQYWEPLQSGQAVSIGRSLQLTAALVGVPEGEQWTFEFLDGVDLQPGGEDGIVELTGLTPGGHSLTVRATGSHGLSVQSAPLLVYVTAPPQIVPLAPAQDRLVDYNEALNIRATATDPDGTVASLAAYFGPWLIAEVAGAELDFSGLLPGWGTQSLRFVATDNLGLAVEQTTVEITITPPVVNVTLTAPDPAQGIRLGVPIVFAADALVGSPATISEVIFEWWGTLPWEWFPYWHYGVAASEPPYTATLDPSNFNYPLYPGSYQYRARAIASFDGTGMSAPITINLLPTIGVTIASPTNGAVLYTGNSYPITLNVEDPTSAFASTEFSISGGPAISRSEPRLDWTPTLPGSQTIAARVFDHAGQFYAAANVVVQVQPPPLPAVQIVEPASGTNLPTGQLTFVFGEVTDPAGVVTNMSLLVNGAVVNSAQTAAFTWKPETSGNYSLQMQVRDRLGRQANSPAITVTVAPQIYVGISHPRENELLPLGEELEVTANVSDSGNMMQRLELLVDNVKVDEADHIHLRWTPGAAGPHVLQVVAFDLQGGSHPSVLIPVTVAHLIKPTIQLQSPAGGTSWVANHPIPLTVVAGDSDGAVVEVQIRSNGRAILTTNQASFTFAWLDAAPGWHELIATARDDTGQFARTDPVRIRVDYETIPGVPAPANLATFSRRAGHARVSWDPVPVPGLSGYVILRKTEPDGEWDRVGRTEPDRHYFEQAILSARTTYSYQVRAVVGTNHQAGPPAEGTIRTRAVMPEYGILDLTELLIGEAAAPGSLFGQAGKSKRANKRGFPPQTGPGLVSSLDSSSPVDRGPSRALGISDAHEILLAHEDGRFTLWYPGGETDLSLPGFQPLRITRSGVVVGSVIVDVTAADGSTRQERRAAHWDRVNGVTAVGGDPKLYREPATHAPLSQAYEAFHLLTDVNSQGRAVGQASYVYFLNSIQNSDADPHFIANHATLWQGDVPINLGGVGSLNGFSAAAAINDTGQIVGWGAITETGPDGQPVSTRTHAARSSGNHWSGSGGMVDLGTLGGSYSAALDVNNRGFAVGYSTLHPDDSIGLTQATLWLPTATQPVPLPNLGGVDLEYPDGYGYAAAINDSNLIVGESVRGDGAMAATLWQRIAEPEEPGDPGTWEAEDLNVLADDDVWLLTNARDINSSGLIVGQGLKWIPDFQHPEGGQWESRAFLLVPGSLLTDANRDGVIDTRPGSESDDRNRVSRLDPWRFWVNDDKDSGDAGRTSKADVPGSLTIAAPPLGGNVGSISGVRDLVDYFPLCLDIGRLLTIFPPTEFEYVMEQEDAAIRFAETTLSPANSDAYLREVAVASSLVPGLLRAPRSQFSPGATSDGRLSPAFLAHIAAHGAGVVLVEGRKTSPKPIRLDLHRGGRLVLRLFFGLSVSGVEQMYRSKSLLTSGGGPSVPGDQLGEPLNYPDELGSDKNFVFLHGYNVDANEARGWQAEVFKRLFWTGSRARFWGVSWYGYETKISDIVTPDYHVNVENAFQTSGALAGFLGQLGADGKTTVAAHSLGNMVVSAALQDFSPPVENYFMIDAAVALEAYDASETRSRTSPNHNMVHWEWDGPSGTYKESLRASEWYTVFPDDDHRRSLTWRGRFDRVPLMNVWNYYSSGEEVLQMHPQRSGTTVSGKFLGSVFGGIFTSDEVEVEFSRYTWALQEKNKGRGYTLLGLADPIRLGSSDIGGWEFNDTDYYVLTDNESLRRMTPAEANGIAPLELRAKPFFRKGSEIELYGSNGSEYARIHRDRLLGEMIPARSLPAGANSVKLLGDRSNLNMNSSFQNGWPQTRQGVGRLHWRHSDVTDVAYLFVWPLYESFVQNGALKSD